MDTMYGKRFRLSMMPHYSDQFSAIATGPVEEIVAVIRLFLHRREQSDYANALWNWWESETTFDEPAVIEVLENQYDEWKIEVI